MRLILIITFLGSAAFFQDVNATLVGRTRTVQEEYQKSVCVVAATLTDRGATTITTSFGDRTVTVFSAEVTAIWKGTPRKSLEILVWDYLIDTWDPAIHDEVLLYLRDLGPPARCNRFVPIEFATIDFASLPHPIVPEGKFCFVRSTPQDVVALVNRVDRETFGATLGNVNSLEGEFATTVAQGLGTVIRELDGDPRFFAAAALGALGKWSTREIPDLEWLKTHGDGECRKIAEFAIELIQVQCERSN